MRTPSRSSIFSLVTLTATVLVAFQIYRVWQEGPWDLPEPTASKKFLVVEETKKEPPQQQVVSAKNIIERNLFDPTRGASRSQESEISLAALQRIRNMILVGTAIMENSRVAIFQEPSVSRSSSPSKSPAGQPSPKPSTAQPSPKSPTDEPPSKSPTGQPPQVQLKLGDTVEGFKLSEIHEDKVIFSRGASKVNVFLDSFVKSAEDKVRAPPPSRPRVALKSRESAEESSTPVIKE